MAFHVYLVNLRRGNNPDLVGTVPSVDDPKVVLASVMDLLDKHYDPADVAGKAFEAIEFHGKKRQMCGNF